MVHFQLKELKIEWLNHSFRESLVSIPDLIPDEHFATGLFLVSPPSHLFNHLGLGCRCTEPLANAVMKANDIISI